MKATVSPLLHTLSTSELVRLLSEGIALLREKAVEPTTLPIAPDVAITFLPTADDDRVLVAAKNRGYTIVNYQPEGLVVDIYAELGEGEIGGAWFDNGDLTGEEATC